MISMCMSLTMCPPRFHGTICGKLQTRCERTGERYVLYAPWLCSTPLLRSLPITFTRQDFYCTCTLSISNKFQQFFVLQYMTEARWNWRMMKVIFTELHFYDSENNYRPFDFLKEEKFLAMQRKLLPNTFKA